MLIIHKFLCALELINISLAPSNEVALADKELIIVMDSKCKESSLF